MEEARIKLPPPLKSLAALPCNMSMFNYAIYSTVNSVQSDAKAFNHRQLSNTALLTATLQVNGKCQSSRWRTAAILKMVFLYISPPQII